MKTEKTEVKKINIVTGTVVGAVTGAAIGTLFSALFNNEKTRKKMLVYYQEVKEHAIAAFEKIREDKMIQARIKGYLQAKSQ